MWFTMWCTQSSRIFVSFSFCRRTATMNAHCSLFELFQEMGTSIQHWIEKEFHYIWTASADVLFPRFFFFFSSFTFALPTQLYSSLMNCEATKALNNIMTSLRLTFNLWSLSVNRSMGVTSYTFIVHLIYGFSVQLLCAAAAAAGAALDGCRRGRPRCRRRRRCCCSRPRRPRCRRW